MTGCLREYEAFDLAQDLTINLAKKGLPSLSEEKCKSLRRTQPQKNWYSHTLDYVFRMLRSTLKEAISLFVEDWVLLVFHCVFDGNGGYTVQQDLLLQD